MYNNSETHLTQFFFVAFSPFIQKNIVYWCLKVPNVNFSDIHKHKHINQHTHTHTHMNTHRDVLIHSFTYTLLQVKHIKSHFFSFNESGQSMILFTSNDYGNAKLTQHEFFFSFSFFPYCLTLTYLVHVLLTVA